jgi:hypothetical protein
VGQPAQSFLLPYFHKLDLHVTIHSCT